MHDEVALTALYKENLDHSIIVYLAERLNIDLASAMEIYYKSRLCNEIYEGKNDILYMDYHYLVEDLIENEPELFK